MINTLISASIHSGDITYLEKFPSLLLADNDKAAIKWIKDYVAKHGVTPTEERFKDSKHGIYWTSHLITSPLSDLYSMALENKKEAYAYSAIREIEQLVESGDNPTNKLIALGNTLGSFNDSSAITMGSLNRDSMYSENHEMGIYLGFPRIDEDFGGLRSGDFCLITGRPKSFKTLSTNFIAYNVASNYGNVFVDGESKGKRVLYISGEMTPLDIAARMDAIAGKFNSKFLRVKDNKRLPELKERANKAWSIIKDHGGDVIIPDLQVIYSETVLDEINKHKPDLVICDAMYRFGGTGDGWRKDAQIVIDIANIARITKTPIIGTNQLNRDAPLGEYTLADIAYSDAYAREPSLILAMYTLPGKPHSSVIKILASRHSSSVFGEQIEYNFNTMSYSVDTFSGDDE